jgi:hypothetical protein
MAANAPLRDDHAKVPKHGSEQSPHKDHAPSDTAPADKVAHTGKLSFAARCRRFIHSNFLAPLIFSKNPPKFDARGVSLGLFIGFVIPVGGQLLSLALARIFVRFNYVVAAGFTLVSNPFNMIPLYYGYYCLGSFILGRSIHMDMDAFGKLMNPIMDKAYFWEALAAFSELGREFLVRWSVAAMVLGVGFGAASYFIVLWIQTARCARAAEKLAISYHEYVGQLERQLASVDAARKEKQKEDGKPVNAGG